ncbi:L-serine ammonia-lyase [Nocardia sp. CDC159]|uniref:L-serine dehydratase n=1 Tax=Nocardia pulmonis TaxID=2951408 RepID=A0A9X2E6N2_9NOCA|nr:MULTISPECIES: L-serine ammonia-lyase [Nocardia]MCM6775302.1 L-serine ammonia-lyase [Nocardia pulmonis]MCM6787964.1 L-serine ammonia-lyase [Nocardia sp. CDC159]
MALSVFDMFSIGVGPSSSHTVGPMRAALTFVESLAAQGDLNRTARVVAELYGSLGATGRGHGSDQAVILGLCGERPESVDTDLAPKTVDAVRSDRRLRLPGGPEIVFDETTDLVLNGRESLPGHPNGMRFRAFDAANSLLSERVYYSIGGGFVLDDAAPPAPATEQAVPFPFRTADDLLTHCRDNGLPVSAVMRANERARRDDAEIDAGLLRIWQVMADCVRRGCERDGILPGGLLVPRRAKTLHDKLTAEEPGDPLVAMDWVSLYAMAVNEENAAGGRVVTAPTNGAAGIVPAVLHYYRNFVPGADDPGIIRFLLTAGAIGVVLKETGSISGAEVGCQGEVGSACAMAAAALTEVLGGTPEQVENAAEIGLEHHLGLTCDPIGGLVQIPCIERNAVAAVKAINASRIALRGNGVHVVSLDKAIRTMRATGADMSDKYKETSRGGLAVNVIEC